MYVDNSPRILRPCTENLKTPSANTATSQQQNKIFNGLEGLTGACQAHMTISLDKDVKSKAYNL